MDQTSIVLEITQLKRKVKIKNTLLPPKSEACEISRHKGNGRVSDNLIILSHHHVLNVCRSSSSSRSRSRSLAMFGIDVVRFCDSDILTFRHSSTQLNSTKYDLPRDTVIPYL